MPLSSRSTKVVVISAAVGLAVIGLLAVYFRRKKPDKSARRRLPLRDSREERTRYPSLSSIKSPLNGDVSRSVTSSNNSPVPTIRSYRGSVRRYSREPSEATSSVGTLVGVMPMDMTDSILDPMEKSPSHLCQLGLEAVQRAIDLWETALSQIDGLDRNGWTDDPDLRNQLEQMIERANLIQEEYERIMFHQSTTVALDSALSALSDMNRIYEREHRTTDETESDTESFVSASEMPDLSDLDDQIRNIAKVDSRKLYDDALFAVKNGAVPHRILRTKMLNCTSDADFLAKLHCVRLAFGVLMSDERNRDYFTITGRDMLIKMIQLSGKDAADFVAAFEALMVWIKLPQNWKTMEQELRQRGVKQFTFYDVCLDFILMDSFDDLASPPSSVTTITHNRWLSNRFKETALTTAVWSVLKAKRRMLGASNGFLAKFYDVSEVISPTLAWGFLGPVPELNQLCYSFKFQGFVAIRLTACLAVVGVAQAATYYYHHTHVHCYGYVIQTSSLDYQDCKSACDCKTACKSFSVFPSGVCLLRSNFCRQLDQLGYLAVADYYIKIPISQSGKFCYRARLGKPWTKYCHRRDVVCPGYVIKVVDVFDGLRQCQILCDYNKDCRSIQFDGGRNCTLMRHACNYTELSSLEGANDYVKIPKNATCTPDYESCPLYTHRQGPFCEASVGFAGDVVDDLNACRYLCSHKKTCNSYQLTVSNICSQTNETCLSRIKLHENGFYTKITPNTVCVAEIPRPRYCSRRENFTCPGGSENPVEWIYDLEECQIWCSEVDVCRGIKFGINRCELLRGTICPENEFEPSENTTTYIKAAPDTDCSQYKLADNNFHFCRKDNKSTCEGNNNYYDRILNMTQVSLNYCQNMCFYYGYCFSLMYTHSVKECVLMNSICFQKALVDFEGRLYQEKVDKSIECFIWSSSNE